MINYYSEFMVYGAIAALIGVIVAIINILSFVKNLDEPAMDVLVWHAIAAAVLYGAGGLSFVLGFILYIVHVCKN